MILIIWIIIIQINSTSKSFFSQVSIQIHMIFEHPIYSRVMYIYILFFAHKKTWTFNFFSRKAPWCDSCDRRYISGAVSRFFRRLTVNAFRTVTSNCSGGSLDVDKIQIWWLGCSRYVQSYNGDMISARRFSWVTIEIFAKILRESIASLDILLMHLLVVSSDDAWCSLSYRVWRMQVREKKHPVYLRRIARFRSIRL